MKRPHWKELALQSAAEIKRLNDLLDESRREQANTYHAMKADEALGAMVRKIPAHITADQPPLSLVYDAEAKEWMMMSGDYPIGNPYWYLSPDAALKAVGITLEDAS